MSTKQKLLSILPHFTGLMSWLGSLSIIIDIVVRKYRKRGSNSKPTAQHRLLLGMSFCDMCVSSATMLTTWPIPADTPNMYATYGTYGTCQAQGFFNQLSIGAPFYNLCLAIYYYLVIVKNSQPSRVVEGCMHFICLGAAFSTAISSSALGLFGNATFWCWIKGKHAMYRWLFFYGPLWVNIVLVTVIMSVIYYTSRKQEKRQLRWAARWTGIRSKRTTTNNNGEGERKQGSATAINSGVWGGNSSDRNHGNNSAPRSTNRRKTRRASDNLKWRAFCYVGSFFQTWFFLSIVRVMQAAGATSIPYWIVLAAVTLVPSQGFFNFLVYVRPRYKQHREKHPEVGRFATFFRVHPFFMGCHNKESRRQSMVFQSIRLSVGNSRLVQSMRNMCGRGSTEEVRISPVAELDAAIEEYDSDDEEWEPESDENCEEAKEEEDPNRVSEEGRWEENARLEEG